MASVITSLKSLDELKKLLSSNPGILIIKLGATWCGPCQKIEPLVHSYFEKMAKMDNVILCNLDVDNNFEVYGHFKRKKIVNGIPALLAYYPENEDGFPDDFIAGADETRVSMFFGRCIGHVNNA